MPLSTLQCTGTSWQRIIQPQNVSGPQVEKPGIASTNPSHWGFKILADVTQMSWGQGHCTVSSSDHHLSVPLSPSISSPLPPPTPPGRSTLPSSFLLLWNFYIIQCSGTQDPILQPKELPECFFFKYHNIFPKGKFECREARYKNFLHLEIYIWVYSNTQTKI